MSFSQSTPEDPISNASREQLEVLAAERRKKADVLAEFIMANPKQFAFGPSGLKRVLHNIGSIIASSRPQPDFVCARNAEIEDRVIIGVEVAGYDSRQGTKKDLKIISYTSFGGGEIGNFEGIIDAGLQGKGSSNIMVDTDKDIVDDEFYDGGRMGIEKMLDNEPLSKDDVKFWENELRLLDSKYDRLLNLAFRAFGLSL